jgi:hypothetical protein
MRSALLVFFLVVAFPGTTLAHRFAVAVVAPFTGPDAGRGGRLLEGFLLATRERDGHAREESDGHLGGLDSHVLRVDSSRGREFVMARLRELDAVQQLSFVAGLPPETVAERQEVDWLDVERATRLGVLVDPRRGPAHREAARRPGGLQTMNGGAFADAFRDTHGRAPGPDAVLGYVAARLIDLTVRTLEGVLTRREAVAAALEDAMSQLRLR